MRNLVFIATVFVFSTTIAQNPLNLFQEGGGRVILEQSHDYKGVNYVYNEWNKGMLVLNDSIFSAQDYIKYDAFNNRVLIKNMKNLNEIIEIYDNSLTGFSILETDKNLKHDFVKLQSSEFNEFNDGIYFEIVFNLENKNYLLKRTSKYLYDPSKSKGSQPMGHIPLEYKDNVEYYLKNNEGKYERVQLRKKDILSVLNKNSKLVSDYIKKKKISFYKEGDVVRLANYYYSL